MLTVTIAINGTAIYTRTAVNQGEKPGCGKLHRYLVDDGAYVYHNCEDGAVALAKMLLDTIKTPAAPARQPKRRRRAGK